VNGPNRKIGRGFEMKENQAHYQANKVFCDTAEEKGLEIMLMEGMSATAVSSREI